MACILVCSLARLPYYCITAEPNTFVSVYKAIRSRISPSRIVCQLKGGLELGKASSRSSSLMVTARSIALLNTPLYQRRRTSNAIYPALNYTHHHFKDEDDKHSHLTAAVTSLAVIMLMTSYSLALQVRAGHVKYVFQNCHM